MNKPERIADLTIEEFKTLIRQTVQESMLEVMIELSATAEHAAELEFQAEMTDLLRASLNNDDLSGVPANSAHTYRWDFDD